MAIGVQRAARSVGLQMPRDLSVVGYANESAASLADPPLTTIAQPMEEMGRVATRLVLEKLAGEGGMDLYDEPMEQILPTRLVLRNSTTTPH
jgi:LacI family transcriptional regulator